MELNQDQLAEALTGALRQLTGGNAAASGPAITFGPASASPGGGWAPAAAPMMPASQMMAAPGGSTQAGAVLVPVTVQTPDGECTTYLSFDGSWGANPMALAQLVQQLMMSGVPVKTWAPKRKDWGGGSGGGWGGGNSGGWGGNRGGGGRGGGYNRGGGGW